MDKQLVGQTEGMSNEGRFAGPPAADQPPVVRLRENAFDTTPTEPVFSDLL